MGIGNSRRSSRTAQMTTGSSNSYKYPPKTDNYFSSHFIMGGERFDSSKPDAYLFGENEDLNFLGSKPMQFPYPVPQPHEPTKTLRSLVNIRRDSVRFVKDIDDSNNSSTSDTSQTRYSIEFTFDSDVKCAITIYYFAKEEINNKLAVYHPRDPNMNSETFHYKRGANQIFNQPTHVINPSQFNEDDWKYNPNTEVVPVVIHCVVEEPEHDNHSHVTFAVVERSLDGGFSLKALKQKQMVDGLCYLLQEIYGIENKNTQRVQQQQEDDIEDNGSECVICMCEMRDTLILPCRHLCLCSSCADNLRYQANNCPICRAKFHALLQIKAMHKKTNATTTDRASPDHGAINQDGIPPGYEAVSLIEALNGPTQPHCACSVPTLPTDATAQSVSSTAPASEAGHQNESDAGNGGKGAEVVPSIQSCITTGEPEPEPDYMEDDNQSKVDIKQDMNAKGNVLTRSAICGSPKEEREFHDTSIPMISDDEESAEVNESTYATPLHQSRVVMRSTSPPPAETTKSRSLDTNNHLHVMEEGRLQITAGRSNDSTYSSSSSTKELLDNSQNNARDEEGIVGYVGCVQDISFSLV